MELANLARAVATSRLRTVPPTEESVADLFVKLADEIEALTAENARLKRVVEQAIGCASLQIVTITEENAKEFYDGWRNIGKTVIAGIGSTERFIAGCEESDPDLYAELKRGEQNG